MTNPETDRGASLRSYPNLSEAAAMLEVSTSTLSRREDLRAQQRGERDLVLSAAEVMRLAAIYRKRALNDVAQNLIDRVEAAPGEEQNAVEEEIERFFEGRKLSAEDLRSFLETARRLLPQGVYNEVEEALRSDAERPPSLISGDPPLPGDG